jgi:hypothetical protein
VRRPEGLAGPQQPLGHRGLGDQEGGGDLRRAQAADGAQRECDLRLARQRGVAAGEDHPEEFVVSVLGAVIGVADGRREQRELVPAGPGPAEPVDRLSASGGGQPAAAVGRDLAVPPVLDRLDEGVLYRILGQPHVAEPRGQRGPYPGRLGPVDPLELRRLHAASLSRAGLRC